MNQKYELVDEVEELKTLYDYVSKEQVWRMSFREYVMKELEWIEMDDRFYKPSNETAARRRRFRERTTKGITAQPMTV